MSKKRKPKFSKTEVFSSISDFHIDIDRVARGMSISVCGTVGVKEFSDTRVLLQIKGFCLSIRGSEIAMSVYENSTVEVIGRIRDLEFIYEKS